MKRWLLVAGLVFAALGVLGFALAASGVLSVGASSGHFALTEWLLNFAKRRSVALHARGAPELPLGDSSAVLRGAGHFESACRPCHGAPDLPRPPRVARAMLPPPPDLSQRVPQWEPRELFYIVKHGIKMTGMPAWPSQLRDDEVGAMVAFLALLPSLDAGGYRRLVHGDLEPRAPDAARSSGEPLGALVAGAHPPRVVIESCARCHGSDGRGRGNAAFPALAGQSQRYLQAALEAYASDRRQSGLMQPLAAALGPDDLREASAYYASLPRRAGEATPVATGVAAAGEPAGAAAGVPDGGAAVERGRAIAERGVPERRVPSCSDCHGPGPGPRKPEFPSLAGQYAAYLALQLELFAAGRRGGSAHAPLMDEVAPRLSREQMQDVARYYAGLR